MVTELRPHYIDVDLKKNTQYNVPVVTQNDTATHFIIRVTDDGLSDPELLDAYQEITMTSQRPDGESFYLAGTRIPGTNEIEFHLGTDETAFSGSVLASLQFYLVEDASRYTSAQFRYDVKKDLTTNYTPTQREETLVEVVLRDGPGVIQEAREAIQAADSAIERLDEVTEENKTIFREPVATFAALSTTYPNPEHGTTVRVTSEAASYRYSDGTWIKTDEYNPTAIDQVTAQLAETVGKADTAEQLSQEAKTESASVQTQLNTVVLEAGDSSAEAAQARVDVRGRRFLTMKERVDSEQKKIELIVESQETQPETTYSGALGPTLSNSSTFSGWGSPVGVHRNFDTVKFYVAPFDAAVPVTQVRVRIKEDNYDGAVLGDLTLPIQAPVNSDTLVTATFEKIISNPNNSPLWLEFFTNGKSGLKRTAVVEHTTPPSRYATTASTTNTTMVAGGSQNPIYAEFHAPVQLISSIKESFIAYIGEQLNVEEEQPEPIIVNLPSKLPALVGQELNIYFDNLISGKDTDYEFDVTCSVGSQFENFYRVTPVSAGSYPFRIDVYKGEQLIASASSSIVVTAASVGTGITRSALIIGDSTTNNGIAVSKLSENFSSDPMGIELIGTRGTTPNLHEGRSGWRSLDYVTKAEHGGVVNAFWNPTAGRFDFSNYITSNSFTTPDYVIINLGINDNFSPSDDASLEYSIRNALSYFKTMTDSIHAHDPSIKIGIAVTIPPNYSQDAFGKDYNTGQTRRRYKRNNVLWVDRLIETYSGRETEGFYLIPIHVNIDTRHNFGLEDAPVNARNTYTVKQPPNNSGVHPLTPGYWQIADVYWYWLKGQEA